MKKYTWHPDEMVLLLDIFFRYLDEIKLGNSNVKLDIELNKLSELLRLLNIHSNNFNENPNYRNLNGMKMMIQNLRYIYCMESGIYPYKGLSQYPRYFIEYFRKYYGNNILLVHDLEIVKQKYSTK
jgi:hypothetical protein